MLRLLEIWWFNLTQMLRFSHVLTAKSVSIPYYKNKETPSLSEKIAGSGQARPLEVTATLPAARRCRGAINSEWKTL